jgi:hypothetical protein
MNVCYILPPIFLLIFTLCFMVKQLQLTQPEKAELISKCDLYYDMAYSVAYSTFANVPPGNHL